MTISITVGPVSDTKIIQTFDEAEAVLAESLPGYEARPQQQKLARRIEEAIASGEHLFAEGGTGTGKSLAYLIPAILSGKRVVVTTGTKALQDQLAGKDLPFLADKLPVTFSHAILKGRANYACLAKMVDAAGAGPDAVKVYIKTARDAGNVWNGERESLPEDVASQVTDLDWRDMTTTSDACPGKRACPFGETCYSEQAKAKAKAADVVVVNHALFFTDLMVKQVAPSSMLDEYDLVVADEAHELEDWATSMLGTRFSPATLATLTTEVRNWISSFMDDSDTGQTALDAGKVVMGAQVALWEVLEAGRIRGGTLKEHEDAWVAMAHALADYAEAVARLDLQAVDADAYTRAKARHGILTSRAKTAAAKFTDFIVAPFSQLVRWVEVEKSAFRGRNTETKVLHSAPIEVGEILKGMVWDHTPAILASATMSVGGSFDYIAKRIGVTADDVIAGTPFDYTKQSALYVPTDIPAPDRQGRAAWESLSIQRMRELVMASNGRALLLFTSAKQMRDAFGMLADLLPFNCMMQGNGKSNKALAEDFAADTHSVLFATRSFFTGVDFQGETLSLVVIDKLPFPVPTEPVTEARCEAIVAKGGSDFNEYTIPVMSLVLQQGFGRLIRHRNDIGCVAILDPRLEQKGYGKKILKSLPPATRLHSVAEVAEFFQEAS